MYVVLGANGRAGGETARALIEHGKAVRVVLRRPEQRENWARLGAEAAIASIDDADGMATALDGASAAFLLNPPPLSGEPFARTGEIGAAVATALRRVGLPKVVVLSSIGAQHSSGTGVIATLNRFEALLGGAAPAIAFLRAGYYVENWSDVAEAAIADGALPTFLEPDRPIPMLSTADVGHTAAALLREDWIGSRIVELSGPEDWSASQVAASFSEILGRPVAPAFVPRQERAAVLARQGIPAEVAQALLEMYEGIAQDKFVREAGTEWRRGTVPLTTAIEAVIERSARPSNQSAGRTG